MPNNRSSCSTVFLRLFLAVWVPLFVLGWLWNLMAGRHTWTIPEITVVAVLVVLLCGPAAWLVANLSSRH